MNTLHIINNPNNVESCLKVLQANDGILLIEDGVNAALKVTEINHSALFVLKEDLRARGIKNTPEFWQPINYSEFVAKTLAFEKTISWL